MIHPTPGCCITWPGKQGNRPAWFHRQKVCVRGACSQPLLLQLPSLQASTVWLGGFLCFSEEGKIWKNSLFECFAPCKWQDGYCIVTNYITLWTLPAKSTYLHQTQAVQVFPSLLPYQLLHTQVFPSYLLQKSNSIILLSKQWCTCRENEVHLSHRFEIKNHKWQTFIQITQHHPSEVTVITTPHHIEHATLWERYHFPILSLHHISRCISQNLSSLWTSEMGHSHCKANALRGLGRIVDIILFHTEGSLHTQR